MDIKPARADSESILSTQPILSSKSAMTRPKVLGDDKLIKRFGVDDGFLRSMQDAATAHNWIFRALHRAEICETKTDDGHEGAARIEQFFYRRRDLKNYQMVFVSEARDFSFESFAAQVMGRWQTGDKALSQGLVDVAKAKWWVAEAVLADATPQWKMSLVSKLNQIYGDSAKKHEEQALAKLHVQHVKMLMPPTAWKNHIFNQTMEQALSRNPQQYLTRFMLAALHFSRGKWSTADIEFAKAAELMHAAVPKRGYRIAGTSVNEPLMTRHWRQWTALANLWPHEIMFAQAAAQACLGVGDWRGAWAHQEDVLLANPQYFPAHDARAETFTQWGLLWPAIHSWRSSVEVMPNRAHSLRSLGVLYATVGLADEAERCFARTVQQAFKSGKEAALNAEACMRGRQYEQALRNWWRVLDVDERNVEALTNASTCLRLLNRPYEALKHLDEAMRCAPSRGSTRGQLQLYQARLYAEMGQVEKTVASYRVLVAATPEPIHLHLEAAQALSQLRAFDDARWHLWSALALEPHASGLLVEIATTYLNEGKGAEALPLLLQANPEGSSPHERLALIAAAYEQTGELDKAEKFYDDAIKMWDAGNPTSLLQAMRACVRLVAGRGYAVEASHRAHIYLRSFDDPELRQFAGPFGMANI